jgi:hypothetical protein
MVKPDLSAERPDCAQAQPEQRRLAADAASDATVAGDKGLAAQPEKSRGHPVVLAQQPRTLGLRLPGVAAGEISVPGTLPTVIGVRGARHNNRRDDRTHQLA